MTLLAGAAGCNSEPFAMVPVSGSVKYDDGSLIEAERIVVCFAPQAGPLDAKTHPLPGRADVNVADGSFQQATSHKWGDGLIRGEHKVFLEVYPKPGAAPPPVPGEYQSAASTPLTYNTDDGELAISVPKKK